MNTDDQQIVQPRYSYEEMKRAIVTDRAFLPFRAILQHEPLVHFIYHELSRTHRSFGDNRVIVINNDKEYHDMSVGDKPQDQNDTCLFKPIDIQGLWLPLDEEDLVSAIEPESLTCPLIKNSIAGEKEILFLIHPAATDRYCSLLEKYHDHVLHISAFTLPSLDSLLIAVPCEDSSYAPALVKLGINSVGDALNIRECSLNIAHSYLLNKKISCPSNLLHLDFIQDTLAYITSDDLGMIYSEIPSYLLEHNTQDDPLYVIPFSALYDLNHTDILEQCIAANGGTPTAFLETLCQYCAKTFTQLHFEHQIAVEAHSNNFLVVVDAHYRFKKLLYRESSSRANLLMTDEFFALPDSLKMACYPYVDHNGQKRKEWVIEKTFINTALFPLTRQVVNSASLQQHDESLTAWLQQISEKGFLQNWYSEDIAVRPHEIRLTIDRFCRYGYAEIIFFNALTSYFLHKNIIDEQDYSVMKEKFFSDETLPNGDLVAPCSQKPFFDRALHDAFKKSRLKSEQHCIREYLTHPWDFIDEKHRSLLPPSQQGYPDGSKITRDKGDGYRSLIFSKGSDGQTIEIPLIVSYKEDRMQRSCTIVNNKMLFHPLPDDQDAYYKKDILCDGSKQVVKKVTTQDGLAYCLISKTFHAMETLEPQNDLLREKLGVYFSRSTLYRKNEFQVKKIDIMPFLGESLFEYLQMKRQRLDQNISREESYALSQAIMRAFLTQIAGKGIVHTDIKADNICIAHTQTGFEVNFIDFEESFLPHHGQMSKGLGTAGYMAPEFFVDHNNCENQLMIREQGEQAWLSSLKDNFRSLFCYETDVFALGRTLWTDVYCEELTPDTSFIQSMLSHNPQDRPSVQTITLFLEDILIPESVKRADKTFTH
ncbi:protein kinase family protein [bacterium]|nr:protein kinase family protein [bacterium]NBW57324.1 protein kinase family protein [bacterium]NBX72158.1 protein kinase family protein [bacterium]